MKLVLNLLVFVTTTFADTNDVPTEKSVWTGNKSSSCPTYCAYCVAGTCYDYYDIDSGNDHGLGLAWIIIICIVVAFVVVFICIPNLICFCRDYCCFKSGPTRQTRLADDQGQALPSLEKQFGVQENPPGRQAE
ncbi:uncharacterized protein LOC110855739 [Folsomia candida]|uniref:Uncharacterized protein n=1 Tax=Folsomia candida TaxID=158441 RepID=A0A226DRB4_FOLCA|nr:uncharacterized protein LOC110855739 [Folsomia candida]XP_035712133.1 uncharacterized protein LOC110855739 [Folsomia candida]OXA47548.1 hypothetical protein Fcan01_17982 [Folsomia candida]